MSSPGESLPVPFNGEEYANLWLDDSYESKELIHTFKEYGVNCLIFDVPTISRRAYQLPMGRVGRGHDTGVFSVGSEAIKADVLMRLLNQRARIKTQVEEFRSEIDEHLDEWVKSV
ncbi:MAG TPA: hypothetical protein VLF90_01045 [Patescibacteria group bacterium]|nr:hypothetical protein [Patescibacteria group bacterium]